LGLLAVDESFTKSIYASEALFVYVIAAQALKKNYVPFANRLLQQHHYRPPFS